MLAIFKIERANAFSKKKKKKNPGVFLINWNEHLLPQEGSKIEILVGQNLKISKLFLKNHLTQRLKKIDLQKEVHLLISCWVKFY